MSPPAADVDLAVRSSDHDNKLEGPIAVKSLKPGTSTEASANEQEDLSVKQDSLSIKPDGPIDASIDQPAAEYDLRNTLNGPLKYLGSLDSYKSVEITPVIGREYPDVQLTDLLSDDQKLKDLAVIGMCASRFLAELLTIVSVSQRGVVFFRNQDIDSDQQKVLGQKLGELTGKPESSKVCVSQKSLAATIS